MKNLIKAFILLVAIPVVMIFVFTGAHYLTSMIVSWSFEEIQNSSIWGIESVIILALMVVYALSVKWD